MKNTICRLGFAVCLLTSCATRPQTRADPGAVAVSHQISLWPYQYVTVVTRQQLLAAPVWRPGRAHPPLPPRTADQLATATIRKLPGNHLVPDRTEIRLVDSGDGLHWYYTVEFTDLHSPLAGLPFWASIVVLMDGTAIEPRPVTK
jgi:hypothetical protein